MLVDSGELWMFTSRSIPFQRDVDGFETHRDGPPATVRRELQETPSLLLRRVIFSKTTQEP